LQWKKTSQLSKIEGNTQGPSELGTCSLKKCKPEKKTKDSINRIEEGSLAKRLFKVKRRKVQWGW